MSDIRKERLMRELLGGEQGEMPPAGDVFRIAGVVALILVVVLFTGSYPG